MIRKSIIIGEYFLTNSLLLKALHSTLGISIMICDEEFSITTEFQTDKTSSLYYDYHQILSRFKEIDENVLFYHGMFNEILIAFHIQQEYIILGPFRVNTISESFFETRVKNSQMSIKEKDYFYHLLMSLPFYPLSQIRELLILINHSLTGIIEDKLSKPLHQYTHYWAKHFFTERAKNLSNYNFTKYSYLYRYESEIAEAVRKGSPDLLKETVNRLGNAVVPSITGDLLRSEKNYSIIVFDRLSQVAIHSGLNVEISYSARDNFIKDNESLIQLTDILKLRDTAILFYTKQVHNIKEQLTTTASPTVISVIQYLRDNLNTNLKLETIAKHFHMSESKLQQIFKHETQTTIQKYFLNLKMQTAKELLSNGAKSSQIAELLAFSSPSNFSRTFKKMVGVSPKHYRYQTITKKNLTS